MSHRSQRSRPTEAARAQSAAAFGGDPVPFADGHYRNRSAQGAHVFRGHPHSRALGPGAFHSQSVRSRRLRFPRPPCRGGVIRRAGGAEVEVGVAGGFLMPVPSARRRRGTFLEYWRKVGGGSLAISLLVHAGLIAVFVAIVTVTVHEPKVDFLPGGGSKQGQEASQELAHQVQQKKAHGDEQDHADEEGGEPERERGDRAAGRAD